jgi:hypothetical protein
MHAHCVRAVADWAQSRLLKPAGGAPGKSAGGKKAAAAAKAAAAKAAPVSRDEAAAEAAGVPHWAMLLRALKAAPAPTAVTLSPALLQTVAAAASGCVSRLVRVSTGAQGAQVE